MTILASIAWWLSTAALAGLAQTAPIPLPLAVTGATPEADGQTVMITGAHFGPSPFVTLDLVPLPLRAIGDTQIAAALPVAAMPPGEYLLTVSRGGGPLDTSSFPLILGGGEPKRGANLPATATPIPSGGTSSPAGADRAVQVGDRIITVAEIDRQWQRIDPAGYIDVKRQIYEMRRQIADSMVSDELLAQEAAVRRLSIDALLAEEIPKRIIRAPDSAVAALYEGLGNRARGATLEQLRPSLRAWLARITEPELAKMSYLEELMKLSTRTERLLAAPRVTVERSGQDAALGPATAPIELVAFGDFHHLEYARLARAFGRIRETFGDRLQLVFKNLPALGASSVAAAEAAQCALRQGQFWTYHDALLIPPGVLGGDQYKRVATDLGLDQMVFDACIDRGDTREVVRQALDEAHRYGLRAGPRFLINGRLAPDRPAFLPPFDFFKRLIEEELGVLARTGR